MAKITSKASLNVGTELTVNTATKQITLNVAGNLIAKDGVTWQALYSKMIDLWTSSTYNEFPFPIYALDALSGQFQMGTDGATYNGWTFANDTTRGYLRDGGWSEYTAGGVLARQYAGIISLGNATGAQLYYQTSPGDVPQNFLYTDAVSQGVLVYGDYTADSTVLGCNASGTACTASGTTFTAGGTITGAFEIGGTISGGNLTAGTVITAFLTGTGGVGTYTISPSQGTATTSTTVTMTKVDVRTYFKGFLREQGKKFKDSVLADTGKTGTGAYNVNLLLSNENDLDIVNTDAEVVASVVAPYSDVEIRYFGSTFFVEDIDTVGTPRTFDACIDVKTYSGVKGGGTSGTTTFNTNTTNMTVGKFNGGTLKIHEGPAKGSYAVVSNTASGATLGSNLLGAASGTDSYTFFPASASTLTLQQIYTKVQHMLRQNVEINSEVVSSGVAVNGKTATPLLGFVGSRLDVGQLSAANGIGCTLMGFRSADKNSFVSYDNGAVGRSYPSVAAGTLVFNTPLTQGGTGYYRMYVGAQHGSTNVTAGSSYGTATAVTVNNAVGVPIAGTITSSSISFDFDYSTNVQGGRSGDDLDIVVVAGNPGSGKAKPVVATGRITNAKNIVVSLVAETDRSYA